MTKNLASADMIVRLSVSLGVIILYLLGVIAGPLGDVIAIASSVILLTVVVNAIYHRYERGKNIR